MADYNSKYTGEQVEQLLDQVASGGAGGGGGIIDSCKVYVWEFDGTLANGSNGTISQEVADELSQAETVVLKVVDGEESMYMTSSMIGTSGGGLVIMFAQHLNDTLKQYYFIFSGTFYAITEIESPILTQEDWDSAVKQDELYSGGDGDTLPRLQVKRGLIEDTETGFTYALPSASEEALDYADATIATTDLAGDIARSVAYIEKEDSNFTRTRVKNGLLQVEVDGELREIYALPNLDDDLQGEADHVLATDKDIQQLDGKVYVWNPTSFVLNSTFNISGDYSKIKNSKIVILDLGTARYISAPITIDASGNITLNFVSHTATGMQIITALISTDAKCTTSASNVTFPTLDEKESWSGKQEKLVSGTNIKTINGNSILGSGNITIEGGGSSGGGSGAYPWASIEGDTVELLPNTYYSSDRATPLNVILGQPLEEVVSEYVFCLYNSGTDNLSVSFEESILWANGAPPFNPYCYTEVSIIDYLGVWAEFEDL